MVLLDIKMPKNCAECDLCYKDNLCCVSGTDIIRDTNTKPSWCPIKAEVGIDVSLSAGVTTQG